MSWHQMCCVCERSIPLTGLIDGVTFLAVARPIHCSCSETQAPAERRSITLTEIIAKVGLLSSVTNTFQLYFTQTNRLERCCHVPLVSRNQNLLIIGRQFN